MDVNVKAIWLASKHAIPVMQQQKTGLFLNTGSISSVTGMAAQGAYAASKGAVSQLTRQMAREYAADGIRCNAVCPGSVKTAVLDKYLSDQAAGDPEGRGVDHFLKVCHAPRTMPRGMHRARSTHRARVVLRSCLVPASSPPHSVTTSVTRVTT